MYRPNDVVVNGQRIQNVFNTQDKAFHSKYTQPIGGFWKQSKILEMEPYMDESLSEFMSVLERRFSSTGQVCMMDDWLTYYAWDAAANVSFGKEYGFMQKGTDVEGIIAESTAGLKYFAPVSQIPWIDEWLDKNPVIRLGPRPLVNGFVVTVKLLTEYQEEIATGKAKKKEVEHFMDKYNGLKETCDFADQNQVINWLMLNVLAGGDSTAGAMRSFVYHLAKNPSAQAKLVAELDAANVSVPAQYKDIKDLPYLQAVMYESQRMSPSLGLILEREVPEGGFTLPDGRFIPAGTKVGINPCVVSRDTALFGPEDADSFIPERWLRRDDETEEAYSTRYRRMAEAADMMFGTGTRVCMGKYLAKTGILKLCATLYRSFDVSARCKVGMFPRFCESRPKFPLRTYISTSVTISTNASPCCRSNSRIQTTSGNTLTLGSCIRRIYPW